jgi:hypothetical protein
VSVPYLEPAAVRESLKRDVVQAIVAESAKTGNRDSLRRISNQDDVNSMVAPLEREVAEESNAFLQRLTHDTDRSETRIRLLREEIDGTERRLRGEAAPPPPESGRQGPLAPLSQRVCPSPLFSKLLWSGSPIATCRSAPTSAPPG